MSDGNQLDKDGYFKEEEAGMSVGLKFLKRWSGKELLKKKIHLSNDGEGESHADIWGRGFQAKEAASTNT